MLQTRLDTSQWRIGCASTLRSLRPHSWFALTNYVELDQYGLNQSGANQSGADARRANQFNVLAVARARRVGQRYAHRRDDQTLRAHDGRA